MSGITHKQAIRLIHRRLDGLLNGNQLLSLEEHLRSCDSCRAYAAEMDLLPTRLQNEFHTRWDKKPGPSQKVTEHVMTKARRIPMANRIASGIKLFAGVAALVALGFLINLVFSQLRNPSPATIGIETAITSTQSNSGLIAFTSTQDGNSDIYTIYSDGRGLTNLTNNPAEDVTPVWSPDGKRIAFVSNRDGNDNIYVMNADGSELTRLTDDTAPDTVPVWSPDGTKIAYASGDVKKNNTNIYVMDSNGQYRRQITDHTPKASAWPAAWSADSQFVLFEGRQQIIQVNVNDGNVTPITPQTNEDILVNYVAANDGSILSYLTQCNEISGGFCYRLWLIHRDGTQQELLATLKTPELCEAKQTGYWMGAFAKWSPDQTKILFAFTCEENGWLYIANANGSDFKSLTSYPILGNGPQNEVVTFDWSSDGQSVVFMSALDSPESESLYTLNVNDALQNPDLRPIQLNTSVSQISSVVWQPVSAPKLADNSPNLIVDPQSCRPFSDPSFDLRPPSQLYGYEPIRGTSFIDGDFSYEFWLYCDPSLKPDDPNHYSAIAGLGIYASWQYTGPEVKGASQYYYEFEPNVPLGTTGWNGPLNEASAGGKFGIDISETTAQAYLQQGTPIQFRVIVDSHLGQNGATLSFDLEPTESGLRVADLQVNPLNDSYQGLIAFTAAIENGNLDIYTMHPDGSGLTNLTNNPAHDVNPVWSPDGKRIAFESDRNGFTQIFLMNSDGSNVVQVTDGEADHLFGNSNPWSPDGSQLLFAERGLGEEKWVIYVIDANGNSKIRLASEPANYSSLSWSPNGEYIAFVSNDPHNQEVLRMNIVDIDGKNLTDITKLLNKNERLDSFQYGWSHDGQSIFFIAYRHIDEGRDQWIAYEASLDNNQFMERAISSTPMDSWWEGTSFIREFDLSTLTWLRSNGTYSMLKPLEHCQSANGPQYGFLAKRSSNGNLLISVNCPNDDIWLYYATSDGTLIKQLLDSPLSDEDFKLSGLVWSPDDKFIALDIFSSNRTDMYVLNVSEALADPSIQPLRITLGGGAPTYYGTPSWQPTP